jgi:Glycosyltransferase family 87
VRPLNKNQKLTLLILIIVIGFSISVLYHYAQGVYFSETYPKNTFLFRPGDRFNDFYNPVRNSGDLDPYRPDKAVFGAGNPFFHFVAYLFSLIRPRELSWLIFLCSFFITFILMAKHYLYGLKSKTTYHQVLVIFVLAFLTYPVIFAVDRSNFDLLICVSIFLFALAYERQRFKTSTVFLAMAISMKPVACVYAVIYFINRKFKEAFLLALGVILMNVISLSLFKDGLFVEAQKFITSQSDAAEVQAGSAVSMFRSDLFNFLVIVVRSISGLFGAETDLRGNSAFLWSYTAVAVVVFAFFALYLWKRPQPFWKVMAVLTILLILLPFNSGDYRLTYLFVPLLMYLAVKEETRNDMLMVILWGLLLVPKNYYSISGEQNIGMVINPLILVGLLISLVCNRTTKMASGGEGTETAIANEHLEAECPQAAT